MSNSVGAVMLDILVGKETISSSIKTAVGDASKVVNDSSATWNQKLGAVGGAMSGVGAALLPASAAVGAFGVLAGKSALSFEDAMAQVSTIADTTQVPMKDLEKSILDLSNQTGISAEEIAGNVYNAISAGQSTGDAVNFVSNATKLAKAGFTDSASALDLLTTTLNAYGLESSEVTKVSDLLMNTQNLGKTTINELAGSMGKIIPTAKAYGTGLDQITTGYAIMTSNGIATAESTTYMNSLLNELGKTGTKSANILQEKTGKSFTELMDSGASLGDVLQVVNDAANEQGVQFGDLFGSAEAAKAGLVLLGDGAETFNGTLDKMRSTTGTTDDAFNKMDTTSNKMGIAWNQIKNTAITLGTTLLETLMPVIEAVIGGITAFCDWFQKSPGFVKGLIIALGILVLVIPPLLMFFGNMLIMIAAAGPAFAAISAGAGIVAGAFAAISWPIVAIISGIAALIAAGYMLWKNWDSVSAFCVNVWNFLKDSVLAIGDWIVQGVQGIFEWFTTLPEWFSGVWDSVLTVFTGWGDNVWNFFTVTIPEWISSIGAWFGELPGKIGTAIGEALGTIVRWGAETRTYLETNVPIWIDNVVKFFSEMPGKIWTWLTDTFNKVVAWGSNMWTKATNIASTFITNVITYISTLPSRIWDWFSRTIQKVSDFGSNLMGKGIQAGNDFVSNLVRIVSELPGKMLSIGGDIVRGIWDGISGAGSWLWGKVGDFAGGIVKGFKNALGIHSPSRVMADEVGEHTGDGVFVGVANSLKNGMGGAKKLLYDTFTNVASVPIQGPKLAMAGGPTPQGPGTQQDDLIKKIIEWFEKHDPQGSGGGGGGDITIPVYLDGSVLDEVIVSASDRKNLRSGGR